MTDASYLDNVEEYVVGAGQCVSVTLYAAFELIQSQGHLQVAQS
jgi:hypothetical protein